MLHVQEETLALLLAVVADVHPGGDLLGHYPAQRLLAGRGELGRIDRLALRAAHVQPDQLGRPRQAAGVRGQDPLLAATHGSFVPLEWLRRDSRAKQRHRCGPSGARQLLIQGGQRRADPAGKLKICGIIIVSRCVRAKSQHDIALQHAVDPDRQRGWGGRSCPGSAFGRSPIGVRRRPETAPAWPKAQRAPLP